MLIWVGRREAFRFGERDGQRLVRENFSLLASGVHDHEAMVLGFELEDTFMAYFSCNAQSKHPLMYPGVKPFTTAMF